ncbi:hypothetical protein MLD52_05305 [Puniceicoccaceae bacterium K14]|nr:hypothetical protein [Puniceicoccaceae bacterium K14]
MARHSLKPLIDMILIIKDELVNPPTWFTSFRDLTLLCTLRLHVDIVIESEHTDLYYQYLKRRGGMDFVNDFVQPGSEGGLRLDTEFLFNPSIVTDRIVPENTHQLYNRIQFASVA